jgi:predicted GNAT family acetyltransferase
LQTRAENREFTGLRIEPYHDHESHIADPVEMTGVVVHNPALRRYELAVGNLVAVAYYRELGNTRVLTHTEVPFELSGQGLGTRLATGVFEDLKRTGWKAIAKCPFMSRFAVRHPEYASLIAG